MAIIRPSNLQTVAPQAAPNALLRSDADIASFGGTQARDQVVAGQQLERASDSLANVALAEMRDANETRVQDLNNQFINAQHAALYTSPDAFYRLKGADAINGAEKATDRLIELKKQTVDAAANPYQRQRLSGIIDSHVNGATAGISRHVVSEQATYDKSVAVAAVETATHSAILDPSQLPLAIDRARGAAASLYKGQSAEVIANAQLKAESDVYSGVIRHMINTNDRSALDLYKKVGDRLDVKDRERIEPAIKTMQLGVTAQVQAREFMGAAQGPAVGGHYDNNIGNITVSKFQYSGGKGAPNGSFETFTTPEHGVAAAYTTIKAKADQNGGSISFIDLIGGNVTRGGKVEGWAEKDDGKTARLKGNDPNSYASRLATSVGLKPGDMVPLGDDAKMETVLRTMNAHEKGKQTVKDDAFMRGIKLAKGDTTVLEGRDGPATDKAVSVSDAAPTDPSKPNGQAYVDPHVMLQRATNLFNAATLLNQQRNANDADQRRHTQLELDVELANSKRQIETAKNDLIIEVDRVMKTGGPNGGVVTNQNQISPDLWSRLDYNKQRSLEGIIKHNAGGTNVQINEKNLSEYQALRDMAHADPLKFLDQDLSMLRATQPNAHIEKLFEIRSQIQKEGTKAVESKVIDDAVNRALRGKVDTTDKASEKDKATRAQFVTKLETYVEEFRAENKGRRPNPDQIRAFTEEQIIEYWADGQGKPTFFDRNFPEFLGGRSNEQQSLGPNVGKNSGQRTGSTPGAKFGFTLTDEERQTAIPTIREIPMKMVALIKAEIEARPDRQTDDNMGGQFTPPATNLEIERRYAKIAKIPKADLDSAMAEIAKRGQKVTTEGIVYMYDQVQQMRAAGQKK